MDSALLAHDISGRFEDLGAGLHRVVAKKAQTYPLDETIPFLLALDVQSIRERGGVVEYVLFGAHEGGKVTCTGDGVFANHRGLSGVIETTGFSLDRADNLSARLIHNPWAAHPYTGPFCTMTQAKVVSGRLITLPGRSLSSFLDKPNSVATQACLVRKSKSTDAWESGRGMGREDWFVDCD